MMGSSGLKERPTDPNPFKSYEMCTPMDGPAEYHVSTALCLSTSTALPTAKRLCIMSAGQSDCQHRQCGTRHQPSLVCFCAGQPSTCHRGWSAHLQAFLRKSPCKANLLVPFCSEESGGLCRQASRHLPDQRHVLVSNVFCPAGKVARRSGDGTGKDWPWFDAMDAISFINCTEIFGVPQMPWPQPL